MPNRHLWFPIILGVSLILSSVIGSYTFYKVRSLEDFISVTGSAKVKVKADHARFLLNITRIVTQSGVKAGYAQLANDLKVVVNYFKAQGVAEKDLDISQVFMDQNYDYNAQYKAEKDYTLRQTIEFNSNEVDKVAQMAKNTRSIIDGGVLLNPMPVEYTYSKLPELRISLLSEAIADAKARAQKMAESAGNSVGSLKSASSGVVQVLPENSLEISDYGSYDTQKINKEVMLTVRASFNLK